MLRTFLNFFYLKYLENFFLSMRRRVSYKLARSIVIGVFRENFYYFKVVNLDQKELCNFF